MLRFLIADDQPVVRQDLKEKLAEAFGGAVIGEAENAREARRAVRQERWSAIVLDVSMLGKGRDVLGLLRRRCLKTPVLVLSPDSGSQEAIRALKRGAAGCLTRRSAVREVANAVREALSGNRYISPAVLVCAVRGAEARKPREPRKRAYRAMAYSTDIGFPMRLEASRISRPTTYPFLS